MQRICNVILDFTAHRTSHQMRCVVIALEDSKMDGQRYLLPGGMFTWSEVASIARTYPQLNPLKADQNVGILLEAGYSVDFEFDHFAVDGSKERQELGI